MNTFKFSGTIPIPSNGFYKTMSNGNLQLRFIIKQNQTNSAYVQMYGDSLMNGCIPVFFNSDKSRHLVKFEDRNNSDIIAKTSYGSRYIINDGNKNEEYIWKNDFINDFVEMVNKLPSNTIYEIRGEFVISEYNNKRYNNFNIKSIKVNNSLRPEFKLNLNLFYNYDSLDESDKRNRFILNAFIEQYNYSNKRKEYYPIKTQFITNRFNFKDSTDVEVIKHRKSNMYPSMEEGYVKASWEAQYVKGAQLILPTLETLPKDVQFEIINAGRDIQEYMNNVVGEAEEFICLTRPDNTMNEDGKVYLSLNCTDNEFKSKIHNINYYKSETLDSIASEDAQNNPFN